MKLLKALLFTVVLLVPVAAAKKVAKRKPAPKPPAAPAAKTPTTPAGKMPASQAPFIWALRFDEDGDYSIYEVEWLQGWGQTFAALDTNSDGILTPDELKGANEEAIKELKRGAEEYISRLDWDKDGTLAKKEWVGFLDEFLAWDKNGDGLLTADEIVEANEKDAGKYSLPAPIEKMDVHKNSRIESDAWMEAALELFHKLDKNHNGRLDAGDFS